MIQIWMFLLSIWLPAQEVDMLLINGRIYTVDDEFSLVQALAIQDGKILETGSTRDIMTKYQSKQVVDLRGKTVFPGWNDGHCHFLNYGKQSFYAQLYGLTSFDEVLTEVAKQDPSLSAGWIIGRGWDQNLWADNSFPDCKVLDSLYPDIPVYLVRIDGHAALANSKAMKLAGIHENLQIQGGVIQTEAGKCTGLVIDHAMEPFRAILPDTTNVFLEASLLKAQKECFSLGLTSVTDAGLQLYEVLAVQEMKKAGSLPIRMNIMLTPDQNNLDYFFETGPVRQEGFVVASVKCYADGALGSRGAALLSPYSDDSLQSGLLFYSDDSLLRMAEECQLKGFQMCVHAIGDRANRQVLETYAKVLPKGNDSRWRVEHCQTITTEDMHYFKDYNILPSIQATHATSDMFWAAERLGEERLKSAYAYKDLLEQNGRLVNGTDFPVEAINPIFTFYASVFRTDHTAQPKGGFQIENAIDRQAAIRSMTIWPAYASFEENWKGSLEPGKWADLVVMDKDIMSLSPAEVLRTTVTATMLNGIWVYEMEQ